MSLPRNKKPKIPTDRPDAFNMERFVRLKGTLVNTDRLLAVQHKPEIVEGCFYSEEHYLAVFDTKQEIRLTVEDGAAFVSRYDDLSPDVITATTSDRTI